MFLIGLGPTAVEGEYGFGEVVWDRTSYIQRGDSKEYTGTTQNLCAIAAGAYLALLGPHGLAELGRGIVQRAALRRRAPGRAARGPRAGALGAVLQGVRGRLLGQSGRTVAEINGALRERGIFGGLDLSAQYPELGQSALFCVTEVHTKADIDRLADELEEVLEMTLRPFHQASWNEPIVLELSTPGERGIIPPPVEPELAAAGGDPLAGAARGAAPRAARRELPELQPAAGAAPLPAALAGDARQRRQHPPRSRDLHDEVQPEGQRGAGPLAEGRRPAPAPGRRHGAGDARGHLPLRADAVRDLRPEPVHAAAGAAGRRASTPTRA